MVVQLTINISDKAVYAIVIFFVLGILSVGVYAACYPTGADFDCEANPGHNADQIIVKYSDNTERTLEMAFVEGLLRSYMVVMKSTSGTAYCPSGYVRVGCSGSREENLQDTCDEGDCGYIGTIPITPNGCKTGIDTGGGTEPTVFAYCIRVT